MSLITISSTNPDVSHVLAKNPATFYANKTPFQRSLRLGQVYGWFTGGETTFRMLFIDAQTETSFGNRSEFEYLDQTRYAHPYIPIAVMTEMLGTALKKDSEYDVAGFETSITFTLRCPRRIVDVASKLSSLSKFELLGSQGNNFKVKLTGSRVKAVLNTAVVLCILATMADEDFYLPLKEADVGRYLRALDACDAPYYLRHLFLQKAVTSDGLFDKLKDSLWHPLYTFKYGNTQVQRLGFIKSVLQGGVESTLVDIGCGSLQQSLRLTERYTHIIGVESDEDTYKYALGKAKNKNLDHKFTLINALANKEWVKQNAGLLEGNDILMTEVLEHIPKQEATELLQAVLAAKPANVVITVPNKDFNKHYFLGPDEVRHDGHMWEPTLQEFQAFVGDSRPVQLIGDQVKDATDSTTFSSPTLGVHIYG